MTRGRRSRAFPLTSVATARATESRFHLRLSLIPGARGPAARVLHHRTILSRPDSALRCLFGGSHYRFPTTYRVLSQGINNYRGPRFLILPRAADRFLPERASELVVRLRLFPLFFPLAERVCPVSQRQQQQQQPPPLRRLVVVCITHSAATHRAGVNDCSLLHCCMPRTWYRSQECRFAVNFVV